jgi:hypothetical protein
VIIRSLEQKVKVPVKNEVPNELVADALAGVMTVLAYGDAEDNGSDAISSVIKHANKEALPIFELSVNRMRERRGMKPIKITGKNNVDNLPCEKYPGDGDLAILATTLYCGCVLVAKKSGVNSKELYDSSASLLMSLLDEQATNYLKGKIHEPW